MYKVIGSKASSSIPQATLSIGVYLIEMNISGTISVKYYGVGTSDNSECSMVMETVVIKL